MSKKHKKKNNKPVFTENKNELVMSVTAFNALINSSTTQSPVSSEYKTMRKKLSTLGKRFLSKFDETYRLPFSDFTDIWFGDTDTAKDYRTAVSKNIESAKQDVDIVGRRFLETLWVQANRLHIVADMSSVVNLDDTNWVYDELGNLGDCCIEFILEDGTYSRIYAECTKMDGYMIDTEGKQSDVYLLALSMNTSTNMSVCVCANMPNKLIVPSADAKSSLFKLDHDNYMRGIMFDVADFDEVSSTIKKCLYSIIECAHQYSTIITVKKRTAHKAKHTTQQHKGPTPPRYLMKYIYLDDTPYEPRAYRKEIIERARPRCHKRSGCWCVSKLGKRYWRNGSIVNKDMSPMVYKMKGPEQIRKV